MPFRYVLSCRQRHPANHPINTALLFQQLEAAINGNKAGLVVSEWNWPSLQEAALNWQQPMTAASLLCHAE